MSQTSAIDVLSQSITLPCGLTLPNRLVKCPMQETCAQPPHYDPPVKEWRNIYKTWASSQFGLLITGQVQVDLRFLSIAGDVCCHEGSLEEPILQKWKEWAQIAQSQGTPCVVQLAHPGRMSPAGAGVRPRDMQPLCPSSVPVKFGEGWLNKLALEKVLGIPKEMSHQEIDEAVANFLRGATVARDAGFAGVQIHAAHGFLVSQFLSPHTNRRNDAYGGTPEKRLKFLQRLVVEIREILPHPLCLAVKLNSGDYMAQGGLTQEEALEQVRWLVECGMVDFVEISGGNIEQTSSNLQNSFGQKSLSVVPKRESTRVREAAFAEFAEKVIALQSKVPIQLSGGFRSRNGMADAIESGLCDLIGLGRTAVLQPSIPRELLLNHDIPDDEALATPHAIRGFWIARRFPAKVIGRGWGMQFFYWNMRRLGAGLKSDPYASVPWVVFCNTLGVLNSALKNLSWKISSCLSSLIPRQHVKSD